MHPVLFHLPTPWGERPVYAYGAMLGLAVLCAWYAMHRSAKALSIEETPVENAFAVTILAALVGGRVAFVLSNPRAFPTLASAFSPANGGLLASGAFALGAIALVFVAKRERVPVLRLADSGAPALAVGLVLVRVGCYLYGCDYGVRLGPDAPGWLAALGRFPRVLGAQDDGIIVGSPAFLNQMTHASSGLALDATSALPVHPTQLYEMLIGLIVLAISVTLIVRRATNEQVSVDGDVFVPCAIVYGVLRLAVEPFRDDPDRGFLGPVSAPTWTALVVVFLALGLLAMRRARATRPPDELGRA